MDGHPSWEIIQTQIDSSVFSARERLHVLYIASFSSTSLFTFLNPDLCDESANGKPETSSYSVIIQGHRNVGGDNERLDQRTRPSVGGKTGNEE